MILVIIYFFVTVFYYYLKFLPSVSVRFKRWWKSLIGKPYNYKAKPVRFYKVFCKAYYETLLHLK